MKAPLSWIKDHVTVPDSVTTDELTARLTLTGLKLEAIESSGRDVTGPLVIGRVLTMEPEPQKNGRTINWCIVDVGTDLNSANGAGEQRDGVGIVCGAHNFAPGDLVVVVLPGGVLPGSQESGPVAISARKTYGHVSTGMICSEAELGLGDDHDGIIVLPAGAGEPGEDVRPLLGLDEETIEFEINPDRAYALSLRGIAREVLVSVEGASDFRDPALRDTPPVDGGAYDVVVEDGAACPVFVTRVLTGVDATAPTPGFIAQRLTQAGMRPISLGVDVSNYVMLETGQPNHCYDLAKLSGPITVRRAAEDEKITTLDSVVRTLSVDDLMITDASGPIGIAGVMGGKSTELDTTSTDIVVEAAYFDPVTIFRAAKRHKLHSEASKRFERGIDPTIAEAVADRVVELLVAHGGATAAPGVTKVGQAPTRDPIEVPCDLAQRVSGMDISEERAVECLRAVGCDVSGSGTLSVVPPPWRPDLTDAQDFSEEVIRLVGYDLVPSVLPTPPAGRGLTRAQQLRRRVGRTLAGEGYVEVVNFPFVGDADLDALDLPADDPRRDLLRLSNPLSSEAASMTTTLLPGLLRTAGKNVGHGNSDVAVFETATVTVPRHAGPAAILPVDRRPTQEEFAALDAALPDQPLHLAVVALGDVTNAGWWGPARSVTWSDAVDAVRAVTDALGLDLTATAAAVAPWHPGRCVELAVDGVVVGHAGELHPRVCQAFGVPKRTVAAEVDLDALIEQAVHLRQAPRFSSYPVAKEDVALVVDASVAAADVEAALRKGAGDLLESIWLFDVYTGDQVGEGKKSLAYALRFRAADRTLKEGEASAARDAAVALAAERTDAVQRVW